MTRVCKSCKLELDLSCFGTYQIKGRTNRVNRLECKSCRGKKESDRYFSSPENIKIAKLRARKSNLKRYGLTFETFNLLVKKQNKQCAICKKVIEDDKINIDHDHKTGKVRGLLCWNCNVGIGYLKDNVEFLKNAIDYLKEL